jgi:hypothetical protein
MKPKKADLNRFSISCWPMDKAHTAFEMTSRGRQIAFGVLEEGQRSLVQQQQWPAIHRCSHI